MGRAIRQLMLGCCLAAGFAAGAGPAVAQTISVRPAEAVTTPSAVDSNSPAFWWQGRLRWFNSTGAVSLFEGESRTGPWQPLPVEFIDAENCPHWIESVWLDTDGTLWGWYHCEPVGLFPDSVMTVPKIGAVVSYDGGQTLYDLGPILTDGNPPDPNAANGYFAGGHGDFTVVWDAASRYFYFYFDNYGGPAEAQGVCVARMAYDDRFAPAGKVWKYYNGDWPEPGIGGNTTPIFPVTRRWQEADPDALWGPAVSWNAPLGGYVMLLNHAAGEPGWSQEGVYLSFNPDLSRPESWSAPVKLVDQSEFPGWYYFYPQIFGDDPTDTDRETASQTARLYIGGVSRWELQFERAPMVDPQAPDAGTTPEPAP